MPTVDIRITSMYPAGQQGGTRAYASATIDGCFAIRGIKVVEGKRGCLSPCPAAKHRTATRRSVSPLPLNSGSSFTALCWIPTGRPSQWHSPMCRSRRPKRPRPSKDSRCPACN